MKNFSIVIATTAGRSATLERCLKSIFANNYPRELYEVILVDSGIDQKGLAVIETYKKDHPHLRFYSPSWGNVGAAKARNLGIEKAEKEIVVFTDDDCEVPINWLMNFNDGYERYSDVAGVGGYFEPPVEIIKENIFAAYDLFSERRDYGVRNKEYLSSVGNEAPFETNNISYKKDVLKKVKGFDERFSPVVGEDRDLKERVLEIGQFVLFIPVKVNHIQTYSFSRFINQQKRRGGAIIVYEVVKDQRLESKLAIYLKLVLSPIYFIKAVVKNFPQVQFAFLDGLGFFVRQLGKIKYYFYAKNLIK